MWGGGHEGSEQKRVFAIVRWGIDLYAHYCTVTGVKYTVHRYTCANCSIVMGVKYTGKRDTHGGMGVRYIVHVTNTCAYCSTVMGVKYTGKRDTNGGMGMRYIVHGTYTCANCSTVMGVKYTLRRYTSHMNTDGRQRG